MPAGQKKGLECASDIPVSCLYLEIRDRIFVTICKLETEQFVIYDSGTFSYWTEEGNPCVLATLKVFAQNTM